MKRSETIEAIEKLIKKYKQYNKNHNVILGSLATCPLCKLVEIVNDDNPDCFKCINNVFRTDDREMFPCLERGHNYYLDWYNYTKNLIKFWTSVKNFLTPLQEDIEIEDIKPHILEIAKPYKK